MKPKQIGKILKTLQIGFFVSLLLAEFFGMGALQALAADPAPTATISDPNPTIGGKVLVTITPAGNWQSEIFVNTSTKAISFAGNSFPLTISADNGFNAGAPNSISVRIFNTAGDQKGTTLLTVNVKSSSTGPATGGPTTGMSSNPSDHVYNPIPGFNSVTDLLINVMKAFMAIIAIWAVAFIVIGGFRMVISQGNEEAVTAAKKTILWAVLGVVVAVLSFAIIAIVQNFIGVDVQKPVTTFITTPPKI